MSEAENTQDNRREYFRIEDSVALQMELVPDKLADGDPSALLPEDFKVLSELQRLASESRTLLRHITDQDRNIAEFLRIQDAKIDLLTRAFVRSAPELEYMPRQTVNLSEGGLEFTHNKPLAPDQTVLMRILLFPEQTALALLGQIIHVEATGSGGTYAMGLEFIKMTDADRQILARHVLHLQSEERRERGSGVS